MTAVAAKPHCGQTSNPAAGVKAVVTHQLPHLSLELTLHPVVDYSGVDPILVLQDDTRGVVDGCWPED